MDTNFAHHFDPELPQRSSGITYFKAPLPQTRRLFILSGLTPRSEVAQLVEQETVNSGPTYAMCVENVR